MLFLKLSIIYILIIICEGIKIGLRNDRPSEEQTSFKTEVMKYKTSECGSSSSEEFSHGKEHKRRGNRNKKGSDESSSAENSDEDNDRDNRRKNNHGRKNNDRNRHDRRHSNYELQYGAKYINYNHDIEMIRIPEDEYYGRQPLPGEYSYQNRWNNQDQNPYQGRNPYQNNPRYPNRNNQYPYPSYKGEEDNYYNRDHNPYNHNRNENPYNRRRPYLDQDDIYSNSNRNNWNYNKKNSHHGEWDTSSEYDRRSGHGRNNMRRNNKNGKNNKNNNDDEECISQCVFNNMQIMEDDGIPSEAAMIKWVQGKMKNEKLKTMAIKEIRRCFSTLVSSDGDNSCKFSKSLASCLKLDLDEDNEDD